MSGENLQITKDTYLNFNESRVYGKNSQQNLTEKEKRLLYILAKRKGEIVSHSEIAEAVWPERSVAIGLNNILQLIFRLRKKLSQLEINCCIFTVAGKGYSLRETSEEICYTRHSEFNSPLVIGLKNKIKKRHFMFFILIIFCAFFLTKMSYNGQCLTVPVPLIVQKMYSYTFESNKVKANSNPVKNPDTKAINLP